MKSADNIYVFDYIEINEKILGISIIIYDTLKRDIWWEYTKAFKPSIFSKKDCEYYKKSDKKEYRKYKKTKIGKETKNFSKEEQNKIKSIFCTAGNFIVSKELSPKIQVFMIEEFGIAIDETASKINMISISEEIKNKTVFVGHEILSVFLYNKNIG